MFNLAELPCRNDFDVRSSLIAAPGCCHGLPGARSGHHPSYRDLLFYEQVTDDIEPSCVSINLKISFIDALSGLLNSVK